MRSPVEEFYIKIGIEVDKEYFEKEAKYFSRLMDQLSTSPRVIVNKSTVEQKLLEALFRAIEKDDVISINALSSAYQRLKSIQ